jgi:glucokinase
LTSSNVLEKNDAYLIGVDVGGTNLRVGVIQQCNVVWAERIHADFSAFCRTHAGEAALDSILDTLARAIREAQTRYPAVCAAGIGFPGFIDPMTRRIIQSPNLPGLTDVDLLTPLSKTLNLPVGIENDALAAAFGEYVVSGQEHRESLIYLGLGTGVGGGLILEGRPYPGTHGVAMEVGHIIIESDGRPCGCGNRGCMEQYASASGVALTYAELAGGWQGMDSSLVAALARKGDTHASRAFERAGEALAQGLATILKVVDVSRVVIGGGMSQSWDLMHAAFRDRLEADLIPALRGRIHIDVSRSADQAGMIGAAMLAAPRA